MQSDRQTFHVLAPMGCCLVVAAAAWRCHLAWNLHDFNVSHAPPGGSCVARRNAFQKVQKCVTKKIVTRAQWRLHRHTRRCERVMQF